MFCHRKTPRKHQIPRDRRALVRKKSKLQKKIQRSTNHQNKENVLNQIKEIQNKLNKNFNKYRKKSKRNESYCCYQEKPEMLLKIRKEQLNDQSWNWTCPWMKRGTWNQATKNERTTE